jgi:hypothetical protein
LFLGKTCWMWFLNAGYLERGYVYKLEMRKMPFLYYFLFRFLQSLLIHELFCCLASRTSSRRNEYILFCHAEVNQPHDGHLFATMCIRTRSYITELYTPPILCTSAPHDDRGIRREKVYRTSWSSYTHLISVIQIHSHPRISTW